MDILKFKYDRTRRLFKMTIITSIVFILVGVLLLFIAKLYLPVDMLNNYNIKPFLDTYGYFGLFLITFIGGTLIPLGSPAAVTTAGISGMPKIPVILVSTLGYTIGILVNYFLAYKFGSEYVKRKLSEEVYEEMVIWWQKWGLFLVIVFALFPVLPFDLIALICGVFRFNIIYFILINFGSNLINSYIFVYIGTQAGAWLGLL
jgi:membrane protein YqaA with SNARE-associated domain